jgi:prephenate dehydrogenase
VKIAVVGGAGKMGQWIARFLLAKKKDVILIDSNEDRLSAACKELQVEGTTDLRAVSQVDLIIISVPIVAFEQTVKELSRFVRKGQTVIDITSVKVMPVDAMHRYLAGCLVLGAHPVFGPGAGGIDGHNVVLTPSSDSEQALAEKAKSFLEKRGARVELMTPAEHDRLMAVVLGLAHFVAIVSGDTLLGLDNLADMELASGVTFRVLLTLVASVLGEDPSLYASIQTHLPELPAIQKDFIEKASQWAELVKQKDSAGFVQRMTELRHKLEQSTPGGGQAYHDMYRIAERP